MLSTLLCDQFTMAGSSLDMKLFIQLFLPAEAAGDAGLLIGWQFEAVMVMLKLWTLLLAYALIICQMYISQAAPSRTSKESMSDGVTLTNDDAQRLLRAIKEFMQITADEQDHQTADGNSNATAQKRACNTATCVTHRLADLLSRSGGLGYSNFVPTNVGAQAFGRRKRHGAV
ncbi:calcitonin gene-related peptide-like isoform X2 [Lates japonicus]|uniref:Calcitonin gene-related peptide-like isoform X2 n=1 Tax=Lates japonicus TaxID=270547 RepID=A0AAD3QXQ5_LATJO|nr:calcitonin gene-related peptide-like isoform X2 [Lates japonicus]